ncbi:hypothetical protein [Rheinheimera mangrovi]|uniref:hypothetical protein n=1 Tax=Rheinheimera mangrovi TaxID=2498451 RepID=UPI000F8E8BEF|nr:hypothetical protein [Rheinheimera mangrovi]
MAKNNADYPDPSNRSKLNAISRLKMLFRRLSRNVENIAVASDYSYGDFLHDKIAALEKRVALLENKAVPSEKNASAEKL